MAGILPQDANKLGWGGSEAQSQAKKFDGDAKELVSGAPLDSDDGPIIPASRTSKGLSVMQYGKKVKLV